MKKNACADSDTWTTVPGGEGCDWVAKKEGRCQTKGTLPGTKGKVVASYACPVACGKKMCRDDASWHKKGKPHLTCSSGLKSKNGRVVAAMSVWYVPNGRSASWPRRRCDPVHRDSRPSISLAHKPFTSG